MQAKNRKTENKRKNEPKTVAIFCPSILANREVPFLRLPDFFDLLDFLAGRFFVFVLSTGMNSFSSIRFVLFYEYNLKPLRIWAFAPYI